MALYIVSHSGPESYAPTFMEGPEVENWEEYCNSLMPEIVKKAIEFGTKGNKNFYGNKNEWTDKIDEMEMGEAAVKVLETKGYKTIRLPSIDFGWRGSWMDNPQIAVHNLEAEIDYFQHSIEGLEEENDPENQNSIDYMKEKIIEHTEELQKFKEKHQKI